ncbi:hypothetical protein [Nonomuraea dietziae]|uniref:hypothetical protein n=1 Tax=Nonomuraea dietziae TaxID=65515 RepID=UPI0031D38E83
MVRVVPFDRLAHLAEVGRGGLGDEGPHVAVRHPADVDHLVGQRAEGAGISAQDLVDAGEIRAVGLLEVAHESPLGRQVRTSPHHLGHDLPVPAPLVLEEVADEPRVVAHPAHAEVAEGAIELGGEVTVERVDAPAHLDDVGGRRRPLDVGHDDGWVPVPLALGVEPPVDHPAPADVAPPVLVVVAVLAHQVRLQEAHRVQPLLDDGVRGGEPVTVGQLLEQLARAAVGVEVQGAVAPLLRGEGVDALEEEQVAVGGDEPPAALDLLQAEVSGRLAPPQPLQAAVGVIGGGVEGDVGQPRRLLGVLAPQLLVRGDLAWPALVEVLAVAVDERGAGSVRRCRRGRPAFGEHAGRGEGWYAQEQASS